MLAFRNLTERCGTVKILAFVSWCMVGFTEELIVNLANSSACKTRGCVGM